MDRIALVAVFTLLAGGCIKDLPFEGPANRPDFDGLAPPSTVQSKAIAATQINVSWQDNSSKETDFRIERIDQGASSFFYVGANVTKFTDSGLKEGNTYSYRVCAIGASVASAPSEFTTATTFSKPIVRTTVISGIGQTAAAGGGEVTRNGGTPVFTRGICWSVSPDPTLSDALSMDGQGNGSFSSNLTGLSPGTTYYVRAYATNGVGTTYGNTIAFSTLP